MRATLLDKIRVVLHLGRLQMLIEVGQAGSFAGAARRLYVSPAAVAQQMAVLERDFGAMLFEREPRGVRLTVAGAALVSHAAAIHTRLAEARADVAAITAGVGGPLAFGSFPTATSTFVAHCVALFSGRRPDVDLRFVDGEPYESAVGLQDRVLDVAVVFDLPSWPVGRDYEGSDACPDGAVETELLFEDPFHLAMSPRHPLAAREVVTIDELCRHRLVSSGPGGGPWGPDLSLLAMAVGSEPRFDLRTRSTDFSALMGFVAAGDALTLLPSLALSAGWRPDVEIRRLDRAPVRRVHLAFPAGAVRSSATNAISEVVRVVVASLGLPHTLDQLTRSRQPDARSRETQSDSLGNES